MTEYEFEDEIRHVIADVIRWHDHPTALDEIGAAVRSIKAAARYWSGRR